MRQQDKQKDQSSCEKFPEYMRDSNQIVQNGSYKWYTKGKFGLHDSSYQWYTKGVEGEDGLPLCTYSPYQLYRWAGWGVMVRPCARWLLPMVHRVGEVRFALVYDSPYKFCTGWGRVSPLCTTALASCIQRMVGTCARRLLQMEYKREEDGSPLHIWRDRI